MRNQPEQKAPLVTYVRVKEIFHDFLRYKYGNLPINLPVADSSLYNILCSGLVANPNMNRICYSSFSMAAYEAAFCDTENEYAYSEEGKNIFIPCTEDRKKLIPFVMPKFIIIGGQRVNTNRWHQFCYYSCRMFNEQIENEFWAAYIKHDMKFGQYCHREGMSYNEKLSQEKFMILTGMDFNLSDNFYRYWKRKKSKDKKQVAFYTNELINSDSQTLMENGIFDDDL